MTQTQIQDEHELNNQVQKLEEYIKLATEIATPTTTATPLEVFPPNIKMKI